MLDLLPSINATLNGTSAVLLVCGLAAIKKGQRKVHERFMLAAFSTSTLFLACYLVYHWFHGATKFPHTGPLRTLYLSILLTHTILATAIVPLILVTLRHGLRGVFDRHRRLARVTLPLWLYVSVTGVVIYFMLYHL